MIGAVLVAVATVCSATIMNKGGIPYRISNSATIDKGVYTANFDENTTEHFDVYGKVQTRYSQVYWTRNAEVPLPADIVKRFDGKVMAITGYEIDQVMLDAEGGEDKSVPIYNAYNHHYFSWLVGKDAEMYKLSQPAHMPNPTMWGTRDLPHDHDYPTNIVFKENPGGEYRKSYHAYPRGYAQLVHSPVNFTLEPMQIDTHNRNYDATDPVGYKPWFLPKAREGKYDLSSGISPLIECPCSDRISRAIVNRSVLLTSDVCDHPLGSEADCLARVTEVVASGRVVGSKTISDPSMASGCLLAPSSPASSPQTYSAVFNTIPVADRQSAQTPGTVGSDSVRCGVPSSFKWVGPVASSQIDCGRVQGGCLPSSTEYGCTGEVEGQCTWDDAQTAQLQCGKNPDCLGFFCSDAYASKFLCYGRASSQVKEGTLADQAWYKEFESPIKFAGEVDSLVKLQLEHDGHTVTMSLSGPADSWFGVGFAASKMADAPYAIIVAADGTVQERRLVDHGPGLVLNSSVVVASSVAVDGTRSVVLSRPVQGLSPLYYSFPTKPASLNLIMAVGSTPTIAYHKARTGATMTLLPLEVPACVCTPQRVSMLTYMNFTHEEYSVNCAAEPRGDMLQQNNPACQLATYKGGLHCCKHQWFLTDLAQDSLIPPNVDTYYLKFRYYFQEYLPAQNSQNSQNSVPPTPASHQHLHHWVFLIDADVNDYEEVACATSGDPACIGKLTAHVNANQIGLEDVPANFSGITPLVMTPHCHAPSCIRQELWNLDTNTLLCGANASYGTGIEVFNERDYVALSPCLWGYQPGLQPPFTLAPDTKLLAVKYFNSSFQHLGQMAQWTGLMVYEP